MFFSVYVKLINYSIPWGREKREGGGGGLNRRQKLYVDMPVYQFSCIIISEYNDGQRAELSRRLRAKGAAELQLE